MKAFVIAIKGNVYSQAAADRCIDSAIRYGIDVEKFQAVVPGHELDCIFADNQIPCAPFNEVWSRTDNAKACFASHFMLWSACALDDEPYMILEHDAVFVDFIPPVVAYGKPVCMSVGKPSYGRYNNPPSIGLNTLSSKRYFPGAHAYIVNPDAASILIEKAQLYAKPTDVFLSIDTFPWLTEYYPWPVEAHDSFTTVQAQAGCKAKHNYSKDPTGYRIVNV